MAEIILGWAFLIASACSFMLAYTMLEHLFRQWQSKRKGERICHRRMQTATSEFKRGYDSPELYEEDMRLQHGLTEDEPFAERDDECE